MVKRKPDKEFEKLKKPEVPDAEPIDEKSALLDSVAWSNANTIAKKFSAGTTSTAVYQEKVSTFLKMNGLADTKGPLLPQANIVGKAALRIIACECRQDQHGGSQERCEDYVTHGRRPLTRRLIRL